MRLYFSKDRVCNSTITNEQGQVLYKVVTPFRPFFMKRISTIWKIIPNAMPLLYTTNRANESHTEFESNGEDSDDPDIAPVDTEDQDQDQEQEQEQEEEIILNMQDQFAELAQIEFHKFQTSLIRWFGLNQLGRGEVLTKEFIPSHGIARRTRTFTGPDDRAYRWRLGTRVCKLYLESEPKNPVAQYHRYSLALVPGKSRPGFLEINLSKFNHSDVINPELLDTIIATFIYVEKLRRDKEDAAKF